MSLGLTTIMKNYLWNITVFLSLKIYRQEWIFSYDCFIQSLKFPLYNI